MNSNPSGLAGEAMPTNPVPAAATGLPGDDYESDPRHAYLEWLHMEARLLRMELFGDECWADKQLTPCGTFAQGFHFPAGRSRHDVPLPSTRAETVLRAVGVQMPEGCGATVHPRAGRRRRADG